MLMAVLAGAAMQAPAFASGKSSGHGDAHGAAPEASDGQPVYLELEPFIVPVIRNNQVESHLAWQFTLEVADSHGAGKVKAEMPRLTHAFLGSLYLLAQRPDMADATSDINRLKARLTLVANNVLGPGIVTGVLVQRSMRRPLGR
jgi:hypothetical protein